MNTEILYCATCGTSTEQLDLLDFIAIDQGSGSCCDCTQKLSDDYRHRCNLSVEEAVTPFMAD